MQKSIISAVVLTGLLVSGYLYFDDSVTNKLPNESSIKKDTIVHADDTDYVAFINALALENTQLLARFNLEHYSDFYKVKLTESKGFDVYYDGRTTNDTQATSQIFMASQLKKDATRATTFILIGKYDIKAIKDRLINNNSGYKVTDDIYALTQKRPSDCEQEIKHHIYLSHDQIIVGDLHVIQQVKKRLSASSAPEINVDRFLKLSNNKDIAISLIKPANDKLTLKQSPAFSQLILKAKQHQYNFDRAELSVKFESDKTASVDMNLYAKDKNVIQRTKSDVTKAINNASNTLIKDFPSVAAIINAISIKTSAYSLNFNAKFDEKFVKSAYTLPRELMQFVVNGIATTFNQPMVRLGKNASKAKAVTDVIDKNLTSYSEMTESMIPSYTNKTSYFFKTSAISGPFGIGIHKITHDTDSKRIIFNIMTNSSQFANIGTQSKYGEFKVTSILNKSGKNILQDVSCGKNRFRQKGSLSGQYDRTLSSSINAGVSDNTQLSSIQSINGTVKLNFPAKVVKVILPKNVTYPYTLQTPDGNKIVVKSINNSTLNFTFYGNENHLREVRALNIDNMPLQYTSSSSSYDKNATPPLLFKKYSVKGIIHSAEFYIATKIIEKDYPFKLSDINPINVADNEEEIDAYNLSELTYINEPKNKFELTNLSIRPTFYANLKVTKEYNPSVIDASKIYEIELTHVSDEDGNQISLKTDKKSFYDRRKQALVFTKDLNDKSKMHSRATIYSTAKITNKPSHVYGILHRRLPEKVSSDILNLELGKTFDFGLVKGEVIAINNNGYSLKFIKGINSIINVAGLKRDGTILKSNISIRKNTAEIRLHGKADNLMVYYADKFYTHDAKFVINVNKNKKEL